MEMTGGPSLWMLAFYFYISATFLFLGLALYFNITWMHIPRGIDQGIKLRFLYLVVRSFIEVAILLGKLGICHENAVMRVLVKGLPTKEPPDLIIKELTFDGVPVRVYWPKTPSAQNRRGVVWIYGGAGMLGGTEGHERLCYFVVRESDSVVACVRYPSAPEHCYPAQQRSCYAAISHFLKAAQDYGVDPNRIVLAGDSSGGTIVARIVQELVMTKEVPQPRAHMLLYPVLQCLDLNLPSYQQNHSVPLLIKKLAVRLGTVYLLGKDSRVKDIMANAHVPQELVTKYQKWVSAEHIPESSKARVMCLCPGPYSEDLYKECEVVFDPTFSPLLTEDDVIQNLPETFLLTCEYDIFRDDGLLYKKRLEDNGVPVTWIHLKDGFHGVTLMIDMGFLEFPGSRASMRSVIQFLERF